MDRVIIKISVSLRLEHLAGWMRAPGVAEHSPN
jgi:hypothetical protein